MPWFLPFCFSSSRLYPRRHPCTVWFAYVVALPGIQRIRERRNEWRDGVQPIVLRLPAKSHGRLVFQFRSQRQVCFHVCFCSFFVFALLITSNAQGPLFRGLSSPGCWNARGFSSLLSKSALHKKVESRKSRRRFGPEKPFVKLRIAYSVKLFFYSML